jgi:hypothetical protein
MAGMTASIARRSSRGICESMTALSPDLIARHEERLRQAQLAGDVAALDELISDELQFVFHDGVVYGKAGDLDAHRTHAIRIRALEFSEQEIRCLGTAAVVTVKAKMAGTFMGQPFEGNYRYIRTWLLRGERWQVVAGSVSRVV